MKTHPSIPLKHITGYLTIISIIFLIGACKENNESSLITPGHHPSFIQNGKMIQVSSYDTTGGNNDRINIHEGEKAEIFNTKGPGVITRIWITIDSRDPHFLRRILLRMYWDDEDEPSVEVPVGDFFGSGFKYKHHTAEFTGMSSGGYYCYFPMPFRKNARIEVVNQTGKEIMAFYYHINYYQLDKKLPRNTQYFHANWRRDARTTSDKNFEALNAKGKGHFVGMNFNGQPYNNSLFYLEGDEMIYVDGEKEPSTYGTGFEDYFTSGWYFKNGEYHAPYHGLVLLEEETGRVTAYRHHIPDAIPFNESIDVTFEHGHGNEEAVDFSTTCYWYQEEPHDYEPIQKAGQRIPLRRPVKNGSVSSEDIEVKTNANYLIQDMSDYGADWYKNKQICIKGKDEEKFTLTIPNCIEKAYNIKIYPTQGPDYGNIQIKTNNQAIKKFKGYNEKIHPSPAIEFNNVPVKEGEINIDFQIDGKNKSSSGYNTGISAIHLEPVREYITDWYLIGPFPNPRESDDLRFGLDSVYPPEKEIKLSKSYSGAEEQEVKWFRINNSGAGYDMGLWNYFDPQEFIISYALTYIYSPEEQELPLMFGSDDGAKVFLNDEEIYRFLDVRIAAPDQDTIPLELSKGWNKLLIKAENNFGGYAFYARIIDRNKNLKISAEKK